MARDNKLKTFCQLSRPEKCWVLTHPFIANKARKITEHVRTITNEISKSTELDGDPDGGQVDAFRHSYWMACLSKKMRAKKALRLGRAHEKGNYLAFKKSEYEESSIPDSMASIMDLFNNQLGIEIAQKNKDADLDSLQTLLIQAIRNGDARMILKNENKEFLDCDRNLLKMTDYKGQWNIPKCLIPSIY